MGTIEDKEKNLACWVVFSCAMRLEILITFPFPTHEGILYGPFFGTICLLVYCNTVVELAIMNHYSVKKKILILVVSALFNAILIEMIYPFIVAAINGRIISLINNADYLYGRLLNILLVFGIVIFFRIFACLFGFYFVKNGFQCLTKMEDN